jgi:hypothetical protein
MNYEWQRNRQVASQRLSASEKYFFAGSSATIWGIPEINPPP